MADPSLDEKAVVAALNRILELELVGVVRYTHDSLMVYGCSRIPIVSWLRGQATESLTHAQEAGERITILGGHPSLGIGPLLKTSKHDIGAPRRGRQDAAQAGRPRSGARTRPTSRGASLAQAPLLG